MRSFKYNLAGGLTQAELNDLHRKALRLIETTGIRIPHKDFLATLKGRKGVTIDGERVRYKSSLVEKMTADMGGYPDYDYSLLVGAYSHNYLDPETNTLRQPQYADLVHSVKLADALELDVIAPVVPFDVAPNNREIAMFKAVYENSHKPFGGGQITSLKTAEAYYQMAQLLDEPFSLELWVISPLTIDETHLDIIQSFKDRKPDIWLASMPMLGVSAPIFIETAFVESIAECLAAATTLKLCCPESRIYYRSDAFYVYPFDMAGTELAWGSPEYLFMSLVQNQVARFYGVNPMGKSMLTMSKEPDAQACCEKAMNTVAAVLNGLENFVAAGTLSGVEIFSPIQMILDKEIFLQIASLSKGWKYDKKRGEGIIAEVGPGGSFLGHDSTLQHFRDSFWPVKLFERNSVASWMQAGSKSILERTKEYMQGMPLSEKTVLDETIQKELDGIYHHFSKG